jgi:hypothetical protein
MQCFCSAGTADFSGDELQMHGRKAESLIRVELTEPDMGLGGCKLM